MTADAVSKTRKKQMINVVSKGVLDCDKPHAFAEGMTYPSLTLVDSKGHRKDLFVYQKKKYIAMVFLL